MTKRKDPKDKPVKEPKKRGKPTVWTKERIAEYKKKVLHDVAIKGLSLVRISKLEGYPSRRVIHEWLLNDSEFSNNYARACELRAEILAEQILDICDSTSEDIVTDENGNPIINHNVINRDRLRIDARKWLLSKMMPKKYGDKLDVTTDGDKLKQDVVVFKMPDNGRE